MNRVFLFILYLAYKIKAVKNGYGQSGSDWVGILFQMIKLALKCLQYIMIFVVFSKKKICLIIVEATYTLYDS